MRAAQHGPQPRLELAHRLVEEVEVGPAHQRAGEAGALLLAAGDGGSDSVPAFVDLEESAICADLLRHLGLRQPRSRS